jgi:hypothetical protein
VQCAAAKNLAGYARGVDNCSLKRRSCRSHEHSCWTSSSLSPCAQWSLTPCALREGRGWWRSLSNVFPRPSVQPSRSELFVRGPLCCSPVEYSPMSSVSGTLPTVADEKSVAACCCCCGPHSVVDSLTAAKTGHSYRVAESRGLTGD